MDCPNLFFRELIEQLAMPKAQRRSDAEDLMQLLIEKDGELKETLKIGEQYCVIITELEYYKKPSYQFLTVGIDFVTCH